MRGAEWLDDSHSVRMTSEEMHNFNHFQYAEDHFEMEAAGQVCERTQEKSQDSDIISSVSEQLSLSAAWALLAWCHLNQRPLAAAPALSLWGHSPERWLWAAVVRWPARPKQTEVCFWFHCSLSDGITLHTQRVKWWRSQSISSRVWLIQFVNSHNRVWTRAFDDQQTNQFNLRF